MKKKIPIVLILFSLLLTGCGRIQETETITEPETYDAVEITENSSIAYDKDEFRVQVNYPMVITDFDNHEVTIEGAPTKLLCSNYDILSTVLAATGDSSVVAGFNKEDMVGSLIYRLYPELEKQESLVQNGVLNPEVCQQEEGALLLLTYENRAEAELAAEYQIQSLVIPGDGLATAGNARNYAMIAEDMFSRQYILDVILNPEKEAIEKEVRNLDFDQRKTVLFLGNTMDSLYSSDVADWIIAGAGGYNAAADLELTDGYTDYFGDTCARFQSVTAEQVQAWNPDVIWIPRYAEYSLGDLMGNPDFSQLEAVKNGRVYVVPSDLEPWYYPTTAAYLGVFWGANNLYPDLYSQERLEEMVACYYKETYGTAFTLEEAGLNYE